MGVSGEGLSVSGPFSSKPRSWLSRQGLGHPALPSRFAGPRGRGSNCIPKKKKGKWGPVENRQEESSMASGVSRGPQD